MSVNEEHEEPLDPAVERVRRKMVRLMAVSIGIMMVGLMAVLFTIVYRISTGPENEASDVAISRDVATIPVEGVEGRIDLPAGSTILSSDLDGLNVLVRVGLEGGGERLLIYNLGKNRVIANVAIE